MAPACLSDLISLPLLGSLPAPQTHHSMSILWALEPADPLVSDLQKAPLLPARKISCFASLYLIILIFKKIFFGMLIIFKVFIEFVVLLLWFPCSGFLAARHTES